LDSLKGACPSPLLSEISWTKMKGIRNVLIHEYFGVDIEVVWETIQTDLGMLKQMLEKVVQ